MLNTKRLSALLMALFMLVGPVASMVVATTAHAQTAQVTPPSTDAPKADAAPVPPPMPAKTAVVENPYGLEAAWRDGDFVTRGTFIILVIMSMGSWYIMITKLFEQFKLMRQASTASKTFWTAGSVQQGISGLKDGSPFRFIAESAVQAQAHHSGDLTEHIDRNTWVTMSIQRAVDNVQSRLQDGLAFLATVGSTAPFVGLFGTVWGIYHALTAIGISGQASIDKVAGPVGEALIMTAIGLAVAVPAVLAYNWLVRRNKLSMEKVRTFGADLHSVMMSGGRVGESGRAPAKKAG